MPFAWISSDAEDGPAIAARLASAQVFVAPGRLWGDERHVRAALRGPAAIDRLAAALLARLRAAGRTGSSRAGADQAAAHLAAGCDECEREHGSSVRADADRFK